MTLVNAECDTVQAGQMSPEVIGQEHMK